MAILTTEYGNLEKDGPLIQLEVGIPKALYDILTTKKEKIPSPMKINALFDTGASISAIDKKIPQQLNLKPVGMIKISTPSTTEHECYLYALRLLFPAHKMIFEGTFVGADFSTQNISCLIGRDILKTGLLIYNGGTNQVIFSL